MRRELTLPELGLGRRQLVAGNWFISPGEVVIENDRLLEIRGDEVTIDLPSPASGMLIKQLVSSGTTLQPGQPLALIHCDNDDDDDDE